MTPLDKPLKRQIDVEGQPFTVTMDATGIKITKKAHRNGMEVRWSDLIKNDPTLANSNESSPIPSHA